MGEASRTTSQIGLRLQPHITGCGAFLLLAVSVRCLKAYDLARSLPIKLCLGTSDMRNRKAMFLALVCVGFLSACASDAPPLSDDRTAVVPGRDTKDLDPAEARRNALLEAARITVDHGYEYLVVLHRDAWSPSGPIRAGNDSAIRPGDDVTIIDVATNKPLGRHGQYPI